MSTTSYCPECATPIPAGSPGAVCGRCLLKLGLDGLSGDDSRQPTPEAALPDRGTARRQILGDYEVLEQIGRGGMGVVYKARQLTLNRTVALKMILAGDLATPEMVRRFHIEAEAAAKLKHPNIVSIFEVGEEQGIHFFSMGLVEGGSLARRLAEFTPFERNEAGDALSKLKSKSKAGERRHRVARLMVTVARAVHYAHQHGVIHRDLKPANILIDEHGQPHLADFGLAKILDDASACLTRTDLVIGTPGYTAPERATGRGHPSTAASDVYSLGAILYLLLTGRLPFHASTPAEALHRAVHEEPTRPGKLNPLLGRDLETITLTCLEKDPQRRYHSAEALAADLDRWLGHEPIVARRTGPWQRTTRWVHRNPVGAALIGTLCVGLTGALVLLNMVNMEKERRKTMQYLAQKESEKSTRMGEMAVGMLTTSLDGFWESADKRQFFPISSEQLAIYSRRENPDAPSGSKARRFTVAVLTHENPVTEARRYAPLLGYLEEGLAKALPVASRLDLRLYKLDTERNAAIDRGEVDFATMGALTYVRLRQAGCRVKAVVEQKNLGKQAIFCMRTNSNFRSLADLRGRRVAFGDTNSTLAFMGALRLADIGITGRDLAQYDFLDSRDEFIRDLRHRGLAKAVEEMGSLHSHATPIDRVIDGTYDAAMGPIKVIEEELQHGLVAIPGTEFDSIRKAWLVRSDLPPEIIAAFRNSMISLPRAPWLEELVDKPTGFLGVSEATYQKLEEDLARFERLFPSHLATQTPKAGNELRP